MNSLLPLEIRGPNAQLGSLSEDNFQQRTLTGSETVPFSPEVLEKAKPQRQTSEVQPDL